MEYLVLAIIGWAIIFILIPIQRIKELISVPLIAFIWIVIVDHTSVALNYYRYTHTLIPIGNASFFQSLAASSVGLLMINWLTESPLSKFISTLLGTAGLAALENIYIQLEAFKYGRFDTIISALHSYAAFAAFIWITLAIVGQEKVYSGIRSRFHAKQLVHH
ncbi:MAG: hypothetical protein APF77_01225 [Clostridia bacterium BRH_c25]|nr:MAG: hypothetical protein APF77_01225 [Clostridia bacterium BRH_c25]